MMNGKESSGRLFPGAPLVGRIRVRGVRALLVVAALSAMQGCAEKESAFFAPATEEGSGIPVPEATDLVGAWSLSYSESTTTCASTVPDFTADAGIVVTGVVTLSVTVEDIDADIVGPYDSSNGDFVGETDPSDPNDGEEWDVRFSLDSRDVPIMNGTAIRTLKSSGQPLCERRFDIAGTRVTAVPL